MYQLYYITIYKFSKKKINNNFFYLTDKTNLYQVAMLLTRKNYKDLHFFFYVFVNIL